MARITALVAAAVAVATLAGCGAQSQSLTGARVPAAVKASAAKKASPFVAKGDDHDVIHAKLNAIVRTVLTEHEGFLYATVDANKDGAVSKAEYQGRKADATSTFFTAFDANTDGAVTKSEYQAGLKGDVAVEVYHHLTEAHMSAAIKPYMADKSFEAEELRDYLVNDLAMTADWPFIYQILGEIDLNQDDKVLNSPGEGPAFLLKFAKPQLQHALGMTTGLLAARKR